MHCGRRGTPLKTHFPLEFDQTFIVFPIDNHSNRCKKHQEAVSDSRGPIERNETSSNSFTVAWRSRFRVSSGKGDDATVVKRRFHHEDDFESPRAVSQGILTPIELVCDVYFVRIVLWGKVDPFYGRGV